MAARLQGKYTAATAPKRSVASRVLPTPGSPVDHDAPKLAPMGAAGAMASALTSASRPTSGVGWPCCPRHLQSLWRETTPTGRSAVPNAVPVRKLGPPARTRVVFELVKTTAEEAMPHELLDERLIGPFMVFYPA